VLRPATNASHSVTATFTSAASRNARLTASGELT
jgi:hypothetical protein